ncbi:hypothetical protein M404DRAFT_760306 [Pisolithus tinctorius Marx 270]|uniref:Uncharacterized protein n=1 Tax=Pisolithus tinctorius Marx 270 TaxID=870435 RepID=A0A0C3P060_PISTI|nr:hypothetical protein M404DRAFT_760306 [Pisolithus tinctorius Marx 270]
MKFAGTNFFITRLSILTPSQDHPLSISLQAPRAVESTTTTDAGMHGPNVNRYIISTAQLALAAYQNA